MKLDQLSSERFNSLRFPLIIGVVFIHAYGTEIGFANGVIGIGNSNYFSIFTRDLISQGLARTTVPLLFLMAGYFFFLGFSWSITNYKKKINSRIKTLLIPFLFWNIFTLFLLFLAQWHPVTQMYFSGKHDPISTFKIYDYFNAIIGIDRFPISYQFWFIRDLMMMVILAPIINIILKKIPIFFLAGIFTLWFFNLWPIHAPSIETLAFFYAGAYLAHANIDPFGLDRFGIAILSSYLAILLIDTLTKYYDFNTYIHNTGVLIGVISSLFLSKIITKTDKVKRALLWAGKSSFFVFAVHEPLLTVAKKIIYSILTPNSDVTVLILYFFIPVLVIVLSISLHTIMQLTVPRFLNVISGGR